MFVRRDKSIRLLLALAMGITSVGGCSGLPRIDPSGQRLLIFPGEEPPIPSLPVASTLPAPPSNLPAAPQNVVAPPATTDPYLPGTPGSTVTTDLLGRPVVVGPALGATGTPVAGVSTVIAPPVTGDRIVVSPQRVIAPIGTEVVVKAGVCNDDGYLLANQRIEWMLSRAGAGEIVTVGHRDQYDIGRLPWHSPKKIDGNYAIGMTSPYAECLDRGTPDPSDDVEIRRGDAWITVSSPAEGTSYVTAYAPNVENWQQRTGAATIYWIDAQWVFPAPATVVPGQSHTLTTTITRQSDGAPIAGWIVRYRVETGTANLGYDAGAVSEVTTNGQGQASVVVSPTDGQPGTTQIAVEIVRPEQAGAAASPRVTLGAGITNITWADTGLGAIPTTPPAGPPPTLPPIDSIPIVPTNPPSGSPSPSDNGTTPPTGGTPDLQVQIEQVSPSAVFRVGESVDFKMVITNRGNGVARNVRFSDRFSEGLAHPADTRNEKVISSDTPIELAPGQSYEMDLSFQIVGAGQQSHTLNVSADGAAPASRTAYIQVEAGTPGTGVVRPSLRAEIRGHTQRNVGEMAQYIIVVENTGSVPATNVVVANDRDPELSPMGAAEGYEDAEFRATGRLVWRLPQLAPGVREEFTIDCRCVTSSARACNRLEVTADGLAAPIRPEPACTAIRPAIGSTPEAEGGGTTTPPANDQGLALTVNASETTRVQDSFVLFLRVDNNSPQVRRNLQLRVLIPNGLQANLAGINASGLPIQRETRRTDGLELIFGPVAELAAGRSESVAIPVTATQQGNVQVFAARMAEGVESLVKVKQVEIRPR